MGDAGAGAAEGALALNSVPERDRIAYQLM